MIPCAAVKPTILTIDIGTSSLKAALWDVEGHARGVARRSLLQADRRWTDWSARYWITALRDVVPHLCADNPIEAIVLSGNGPTVVAVDHTDQALDPVLLWLDNRSASPKTAESSYYLPKIEWLARHARESGRAVKWFLPFPEYLIYWMTGEAVAVTPGRDFRRSMWEPNTLDGYSVESSQLPPYVGVGARVGELRAEPAALLGLRAGTPVISGGPDFLMSLLGTAAVDPGQTCDRAGTSEGINFCSDRRIQSEKLRVLPHVIEGRFNVAGILASTGLLFEWFRDISGQHGRDYAEMILEILNADAGKDGPWFFPSAQRGAAWEFRSGMFVGLGADQNRAVMGRAVVLSIGFAVREAVEILGAAGCAVSTLRSCGGQARNRLWNQMKADIVGVPLLVPEVVDAELTGNLCAALVGLGRFEHLAEAARALVRFEDPIEPRSQWHSFYTDLYHRYQANYEGFWAALEQCR